MGLGEKAVVIVASIAAVFVALSITRSDTSSTRWVIVLGAGVVTYVVGTWWRKNR
jgi:hypothetical protein